MDRIWGQYVVLAGLALAVHVPVRAETTHTKLFNELTRNIVPESAQMQPRDDGKFTSGTAAVVASNLPLERIIAQVQSQSGVSIRLRGNLQDKHVSLIAPKPQPVARILEMLEVSNSDLHIKEVAGGYEVWDAESYQVQSRVVKVYPLQHARPRDVSTSVMTVLTPVSGVATRDDRLNQLVVYDVPEKQHEVAELLRHLDKDVPTRVFSLRHTSARQITDSLVNFLDVSPRQISADDRTQQVLLKAPLAVLRQAEMLVQAYDVPAPE